MTLDGEALIAALESTPDPLIQVRDERRFLGRVSRFVALVPQNLEIPFSFRVDEIVAQGRVPYLGKFGAMSAQRSVLSIENFISAVATALSNPRARGETFIVSNPAPVTVAHLIARHRASLGRPPWLMPVWSKCAE